MSKLKSKDAIAAHVASFPGVDPERKKQIADHLTALPANLHDPVHDVLVDDVPDDPESKFIVGCFEAPPALKPAGGSGEHPGLPPAA